MMTREELTQNVFNKVKVDLPRKDAIIWKAIAETDDASLCYFWETKLHGDAY